MCFLGVGFVLPERRILYYPRKDLVLPEACKPDARLTTPRLGRPRGMDVRHHLPDLQGMTCGQWQGCVSYAHNEYRIDMP